MSSLMPLGNCRMVGVNLLVRLVHTPRLRLVYLRIGYVLSYHQDSLEAIIKIDYPKIVFLWSILNY